MLVRKKVKLNDSDLFDIWYYSELDRLERTAHSCKGFLTGDIEEYLPDVINKKLSFEYKKQREEMLWAGIVN